MDISNNETTEKAAMKTNEVDIDDLSFRKRGNTIGSKQSKRRARRLRQTLQRALDQVASVIPGHGESPMDNDTAVNDTSEGIMSRMKTNDGRPKSTVADKLFESMDVDSDGYVTVQELLSSKFGFGDNDLNMIDVDRDGRISRKELRIAVESATSSSQQNQDLISEEIDDVLGDLEPLERQEMRLEGFEPYILVSVLTAEGSFEMISEMNNVEWGDIRELLSTGDQPLWQVVLDLDWLSVATLFSAAFSTITGIYATTVFSLSMLYGKTALGLGRDAEYFKFMDATGLQRYKAFQSFSLALLSFCTSVLLLVALRAPTLFRIPLAVSSVVILVLGHREYEGIVEAARPIFAQEKKGNTNTRES
jgi:Ca2+-binding EF-hand superfamily protein